MTGLFYSGSAFESVTYVLNLLCYLCPEPAPLKCYLCLEPAPLGGVERAC
jgi:hypothetical protein